MTRNPLMRSPRSLTNGGVMSEELLLSVPAATRLAENAVRSVRITPVAFHDPPLLNTVGVHEPLALRAIVQVTTESVSYTHLTLPTKRIV